MQLKHLKEIVCIISDICQPLNVMDVSICIPGLSKEGITIKTNGPGGIGTNTIVPIFPELSINQIDQKLFMENNLEEYSKIIYDYEENGEKKFLEIYFKKNKTPVE